MDYSMIKDIKYDMDTSRYFPEELIDLLQIKYKQYTITEMLEIITNKFQKTTYSGKIYYFGFRKSEQKYCNLEYINFVNKFKKIMISKDDKYDYENSGCNENKMILLLMDQSSLTLYELDKKIENKYKKNIFERCICYNRQ